MLIFTNDRKYWSAKVFNVETLKTEVDRRQDCRHQIQGEDTNLELSKTKVETNFVNVEENVIIFGGNQIENKKY